jgi:hypothetical protein
MVQSPHVNLTHRGQTEFRAPGRYISITECVNQSHCAGHIFTTKTKERSGEVQKNERTVLISLKYLVSINESTPPITADT